MGWRNGKSMCNAMETSKTVLVSTPSGGNNYYFLYHSNNKANEQLLRDCLHTQTKLRNVVIDIRSDGGYVVEPNSTINNKLYSYFHNSQKNQLQEIPTKLTELLKMVPKEYCDNYLKWLSITNVLKGLNKQEMWDT